MAVEIRVIQPTPAQLKQFVHFGIDLYKGNEYYVPALVIDEIDTLNPAKNPAFDFCESRYFMAFRDGKPVGRIAAIINRQVNERSGKKTVRFGFVDFIDDDEVVDALFDAVKDWGRQKGLDTIVGPLGFTDMDNEGMLTDGFDQLGTMATIYNYPYYNTQMKRMGFEVDASWVEFKVMMPEGIPDKHQRICDIVRRKYGVRNVHFKSKKELVAKYGRALFELINKTYDQLYGYSPLTPKQIDHYIKMYVPIVRLENLSVIVDSDDRLVGLGLAMPSLSKALIKSRGRLFPTGWYHLLKALKAQNDIVDLLLVAVEPEYQSKGVNSLLFTDLIPSFIKQGYKCAETNPELETNQRVQSQWQYFDTTLHKRRCSYKASF
ncbi:MAG: N-acetyltransferase [Muribaculaceae bacterium]|nr:N-acetyltransferase [Muribaculaceae bacterium]